MKYNVKVKVAKTRIGIEAEIGTEGEDPLEVDREIDVEEDHVLILVPIHEQEIGIKGKEVVTTC